MANPPGTIRIATRGSRLALIQTELVAVLLRAAQPGLRVELVPVATRGDRQQDVPLVDLQGPDGVFTRAVEVELLEGRAEVAVHSLKDLPTATDPALAIGAIPPRGDARDVLISPRFGSFAQLPPGAVVGTSSPRRAAQVQLHRPDLQVEPVRGNVETRLRKLDDGACDALVLAGVGLERLGLSGRIAQRLPVERFTPAVGQGALAVQCRADDGATRRLLVRIHDPVAAAAIWAERTFLQAVGGGCRLPIGGYAVVRSGELRLTGFLAAPDGSEARWATLGGPATEAERIGRDLAEELLAMAGPAFLTGVRSG